MDKKVFPKIISLEKEFFDLVKEVVAEYEQRASEGEELTKNGKLWIKRAKRAMLVLTQNATNLRNP